MSEVWTGSFQGGGGTELDGKEEFYPHLEQGEAVGLDSCCLFNCCSASPYLRYNVSCSHQFRLQRKKMKEFQEANYARVRRRGSRRSSSEIARTKIQGKRHRVRTRCFLPLSRQVSVLHAPLFHSGCSRTGCGKCTLTQSLLKA